MGYKLETIVTRLIMFPGQISASRNYKSLAVDLIIKTQTLLSNKKYNSIKFKFVVSVKMQLLIDFRLEPRYNTVKISSGHWLS